MLRGLVVGLLAANLLFWAWTAGWLTSLVGVDPAGDREPQRLATQVAPDTITLRPPVAAGSAGGAATEPAEPPAPPPVCLEAGPFAGTEAKRIQALAKVTLPEGAWTVVHREKPGAWITYTGRYASRESQQRKAEELKRLNVSFDELHGFPELEPGFVYGRYNNIDDAQAAVRRLVAQRVRTARVVQLAPPISTDTLRLPQADTALQERAAALKPQLGGKAFVACRE